MAPALTTKDEHEESIPEEDAEPDGWFTYNLCVLLKGGPTAARVAFCGSQPESDVRRRCYSHLNDSPVSWTNWCYNEVRNDE